MLYNQGDQDDLLLLLVKIRGCKALTELIDGQLVYFNKAPSLGLLVTEAALIQSGHQTVMRLYSVN